MEETTTQPQAGSNKKILYIIGGLIVLGLIGSTLMRGVGYMGMRAAGVDVRPNMDGSATYTATNGEGSVTVGGNKMPDNWPSDAPANFAGATISYSGSSNPQTGQAGSAVMYTVKSTAEAVAAYYKSQLESQGWKIEQTANMGGATVLAAKKDTRTFGIYIMGGEGGEVSVQASISM
jgi:hypothetical protein